MPYNNKQKNCVLSKINNQIIVSHFISIVLLPLKTSIFYGKFLETDIGLCILRYLTFSECQVNESVCLVVG